MTPPPITLCLAACVCYLGWQAIDLRWTSPAASSAVAQVIEKAIDSGSDEFANPGETSAPPPIDPSLKSAALNRPLFSETRRPIEREIFVEEVSPSDTTTPEVIEVEDEPVVEAPPPPPPLPSFTLSGVMVDGDHKSALISVDGGDAEWREEGYEEGQWRIISIEPERIVIRGQVEDALVDLYPRE